MDSYVHVDMWISDIRTYVQGKLNNTLLYALRNA